MQTKVLWSNTWVENIMIVILFWVEVRSIIYKRRKGNYVITVYTIKNKHVL